MTFNRNLQLQYNRNTVLRGVFSGYSPNLISKHRPLIVFCWSSMEDISTVLVQKIMKQGIPFYV